MSEQIVATVVYGSHAEQLDRTFTSFAQNPFFKLHAFVLGEHLPVNRCSEVTYHLREPDPSFSHPMRDADYRRWILIDELDVDYALVVDGLDVLCLQPIPEIPTLLKGGAVGAVVEHFGSRYVAGGVYTGNFVNAGVTFWNIASSREIRREVLERGKTRFRNYVDDQLSLNEILYAGYLDSLTLLPCVYNYRAYINRSVRGYPRVDNMDGVKIYHHDECLKAKSLRPLRSNPRLEPLVRDAQPLGMFRQFLRRVEQRLKPHVIR